jgi:hypothetical protein
VSEAPEPANVRKPMSKTLRFEVFKRDNFSCQYCGKSAPEVILHVDHINPVAGGGENDILNLITACQDCNLGKGARLLSDDSAIAKQRAQLADLNERREQLEMMLAWRESLAGLDDEYVDAFNEVFEQHTTCHLNEHGRKTVKGWLKKHDLTTLIDALESALGTYFKTGSDDPEENNRLAGHAFNMTVRVIASQKANSDKPWMKDLFYIRAIARNRFAYHKDDVAIVLLKRAFEAGIHLEDLKDLAKTARNWSQWKATIEDWLEDGEGE